MYKFAFFDALPYDRPGFDLYGRKNCIVFKYLETKLDIDTVELARGCDGICVFVNDDLNAQVIEKLYEYGIKIIALRCAGFNNVDVKAAYKKKYTFCGCRLTRPTPWRSMPLQCC